MKHARGKVRVLLEFVIEESCEFEERIDQTGRDLIQDIAVSEVMSFVKPGGACKFYDSKILEYTEKTV